MSTLVTGPREYFRIVPMNNKVVLICKAYKLLPYANLVQIYTISSIFMFKTISKHVFTVFEHNDIRITNSVVYRIHEFITDG